MSFTKIDNNNIAPTGVTAGSYTNANITVNESGQITSASNGVAGTGGGGGGGTGLQHTTYTYTANGSTTTFAATSGITVHTVLVILDGVTQMPTTDYTVSGSNVIFTSAPPANSVIQIRVLGDVASSGGGPKISNIAITDSNWDALDDTAVDIAGGYIKITGTGFVSGCLAYFNQTAAASISFVSSTELRISTGALAASTYVLYVINPDGGVAISVPGVTFSATPAWQTASSLSDQYDGVAITLSLVAQDATSYTLVSGSLPPGLSLNTSTGAITGTVVGVTVETIYTFTVRATDAQNQDSPRTFTVTITVSDPYFNSTTLLLSGSAISANTVIRDSSTNNFNLTVAGDARASNFSPYGTGWSVYFDGTGDYLNAASNAAFAFGTGNFTIEAWIFPTSTTSYRTIFTSRGTAANSVFFGLDTGTLFPVLFTSAAVVTSSVAVTLNSWNHVALVRNSGTSTIYVNGVSGGSASNTTDYTATNCLIGIENTSGQYPWFGYISDLRIVKGTAVYTTAFTPPIAPLTSVANTSLLTCNANRFLDSSANNLAITRNGDAKIVSFNPFGITNTGVNGSMYFDGTGDYLQIPTNTAFNLGTGAFCVEFWVYITSLAEQPSFINNNSTNIFYETNGSNRGLCLYASAAAQLTSPTTALPLNSWNHVVICRNTTGTLSSFVNGTRLATAASNTSNVDFSNAIINRYFPSVGGHLFGYTSDLRMVKGSTPYDPTLATCTVPTAPLTAIANTQLLTLQYDQPHNNHTFLDSSSNQHLITRNGNATQGTFSPFSPNGWSNFYNSTQTNWPANTWNTLAGITFTIECWLYPTANGGIYNGMILGNNVSGRADATWFFFSDTAKVGIGTAGSSNWTGFSSTNSVSLNSWSHVAITIDGPSGSATAKIYINGVLDSTHLNRSTNIPTDIGNCLTGTRGDNTFYNYYGYISNLRITKNQVLYTGNFTPPIAALTTSTVGTTGANVASSITGTVSAILYGNERLINKVGSIRPDSNSSVVQAFSPFAPTAVYNPVVHGGSAYFDRTGDFLSLATNNSFDFGIGNFTVELFYYPLAYDDIQIFFSGTSNYQFGYSASDSRNLYYYGSSGNVISGTPAASMLLNQWNHIVLVRSGTSLAIMSNGVRQGTATHSSSVNFSGSPIVGGYADSTASYAIRGYMAGFRAVKGVAIYDPTQTTYTVPTAPVSATTNTSLLLNFTDAAILDSTGRTVIETAGDAKVTTIQTKFGTTSQFYNGSNTNLIVPVQPYFSFPGTTSFTVEAWVYFNDLNTQLRPLIALGDGANGLGPIYNAWSLQYWGTEGSNQIGWGRYDGTEYTYLTSGLSLVANTWYHIAVSRDSANTLRIFVNGVSYYSATVTQTFAQVNSNPLRIGLCYNGPASGYGGPRYFNGYIDDIRITQGHARYTANFTAPTAPHRLK